MWKFPKTPEVGEVEEGAGMVEAVGKSGNAAVGTNVRMALRPLRKVLRKTRGKAIRAFIS